MKAFKIIGQYIAILLLMTACTVEDPEAKDRNGDREPSCENALMCQNSPGWLIDFNAPLPYNLALIINDVLVKDECRTGDQGAAIVDRDENRIEIEYFYPPERANDIKLIDRGSNCLGKSALMNRLTGREIKHKNRKYFYFKTSF